MSAEREQILIYRASEHNLQQVSCALPRDCLVAVTGPSGAGKSTLVFDTLYAWARATFDLRPDTAPDVERVEGLSLPAAVDARRRRPPFAAAAFFVGIYDYLRLLYFYAGIPRCLNCGERLLRTGRQEIVEEISKLPQGTLLSVHAPLGPVPPGGLQQVQEKLLEQGFSRVLVNEREFRLESSYFLDEVTEELSEKERAVEISVFLDAFRWREEALSRLIDVLELAVNLSGGEAVFRLSGEELQPEKTVLRFSEILKCRRCGEVQEPIQLGHYSYYRPGGCCPLCRGLGETDDGNTCALCSGARVEARARARELAGLPFERLFTSTVREALLWSGGLEEELRAERREGERQKLELLQLAAASFRRGLQCLADLGLDYISLCRPVTTLSSGEFRRLQLARELKEEMNGLTYLIDEPSIGLHPRDTARLISVMNRLRERGGSLIYIEHDLQLISAADHVLELGPGSGRRGGQVVFNGRLADLLQADTLTGRSLAAAKPPQGPPPAQESRGSLALKRAAKHNLRQVNVELPLGLIVGVAGVSGSGKSTLISSCLYPALLLLLEKKRRQRKKIQLTAREKEELHVAGLSGWERISSVVNIGQAAGSGNPRSVVATTLGIFKNIRELFAQTIEARIRGYSARHFSFNLTLGACPRCVGRGELEEEVRCLVCGGSRYKKEIEEVHYKGLSIAGILGRTVEQALEIFGAIPEIKEKLALLAEFGLDYLQLGQPVSSLSQGELQRLRLAAVLSSGGATDTLYLFDEPTTGLHSAEVDLLALVLRKLAAAGNSIVVIEHNTKLLAACNYIIELGPGGGPDGGTIVAAGTAAELRLNPASIIKDWL